MKHQGSFIAHFVNKPVTIFMIAVAILVVGALAFLRIPVRLLPEGTQSQTVTVYVPLNDYNPKETEDKITKPLEESLRTIPGVTEISSRSQESSCSIRVNFTASIDMSLGKAEVRDRVERVRPTLPEEVDRIFVWSFNMDEAAPVMFVGMLFESRDMETQDVIDQVIDPRITAVDGVARVQIWGGTERTVRILFDEERVRGLGINLLEVIQLVSRDNFIEPAGKLREAQREYFIRVDAEYRDLEAIRNIPIRPDLRIGDVADVIYATSVRNELSRINGKDAYFAAISKTSDANTVEVCERIEKAIDELRGQDNLRGFDALTFFSQGKMIEGSIKTLSRTAVLGGLTAILVLWLFLRRMRMTLLITLSIPLSLLVTLIGIYFMGGTFNILTMMGITLAIGMLVDNAVVVVENIHRLRELGASRMDAAIRGAREVGLAIFLATLTTVAVFAPLMFMSDGFMKVIFGGLGTPVCLSLFASLFMALLVLPTAIPRWGESRRARREERDRSSKTEPSEALEANKAGGAALGLLSRINNRWLSFTLRHRLVSVLLAIFIAGSLGLAGSLVNKSMNGDEDGDSAVRVKLEFGSNFTLWNADQEARVYENLVRENQEDLGYRNLSVRVSETRGSLSLFYDGTPTEEEQKARINKLKKLLPERPGVKIKYPSSDNDFASGSAEGKDRIALAIRGPDSDRVRLLGQELASRFELHPGLTSVETSMVRGRDEIKVIPDREAMARGGVDAQSLVNVIRWGLSGFPVSKLNDNGRDLRILMQYERGQNESLGQLADMQVFTDSGRTVPVGSVASIEQQKALGSISRRDGRASFSVSARAEGEGLEKKWGMVREALAPMEVGSEKLDEFKLPSGYEFVDSGGMREWDRDFTSMKRAGVLAAGLVYVVMGILFESFLLPFSILCTIPFAIAGALWALVITNMAFDMVAMIGMIVLVGVVVNNGVVLIDHINRLRRLEGLKRPDAIRRAARERLRPILMTSMTTIAGLIPAALETTPPGGGISYQTLSVAVIGGLFLATLCTLWVVPLLYTLFEDASFALRRSVLRRTARPQAELAVACAPSFPASEPETH